MTKFNWLFAFCLILAASPQAIQAQGWFEADYLFWSRGNDSSRQFIQGSSPMNSEDFDIGFSNGYRLTVGTALGDYELEAQYSKVDGWSDSLSGVLARPLALDDDGGNAIVYPAGADSLGFRNGLFDAATFASQSIISNEQSESEFLLPGTVTAGSYTGKLQDFQVNFGTSRTKNWYRFGVGYRNIRIQEGAGFLASGGFNALDNNDAAGPGGVAPPVNDPNDGLSHAALTAAGFTNIGGGADGYDAINPAVPTLDRISALFNGQTDNELNGLQLSAAARMVPSEIFEFEVFGRLGLFHNRASGGYAELLAGGGTDNSNYLRSFVNDRERGSFGANFGIKGLLNITDYISLTAGYEVLVLTNIALAPDQIGNVQRDLFGNPHYALNASGLFFGHGGNLGLEIRW
ncbi:MAG: hypothetical protein R3B90_01745 [Planctomycetaceae bacterium]